MAVPYQSLAEMFVSQANRYRQRTLYRFSREGRWDSTTWEEALTQVREIALGLVSLGVKKGDRVALFSANRVEWSLVDWANICIGALTVPLYSSSTPAEVGRLVSHSQSTTMVVDTVARWAKFAPLASSLPQLKRVILMESETGQASARVGSFQQISLQDLRVLGRRYGEIHEELFDRMVASLRPGDDLTIVYTSGTTGEPKGVLTTHGHYLFMVDAAGEAIPSSDQEVTLQFLPFAHSFGRLEHFMVVAKGFTCGFARSLDSMGRDLLEVRPTLLFSVPRVYENAFQRIRSRMASGGLLRRLLSRWALSIGKEFSRYQTGPDRVPWSLRAFHYIAHLLVFSKIHQGFGGRLRFAISGGAPLAAEIAEFFHAVGILILEGYGLTETSTVSHVNRRDRYRFGTVGFPLPGVECRIAPDGEILLKGPNIFKGYYMDPKGKADILGADGWFHTMDVGELDHEGFLRITDRKNDLIVTSGGKKVAPQAIENLFKTDSLISQVMVLGDGSSHICALISLDRDRLMEWAKQEGLIFHSIEETISHPRTISLVRDKIRVKNRGLAPFETIRDFRIVPREFSLGGGELTPTIKLKRRVVMDLYGDLVRDMMRKPQVGS